MQPTVDAILLMKEPHDPLLLDPLIALAQFALDTFGEGGNPEAEKYEDFLGYVNTPLTGDYIRVRIGYAYGQALEYIEENGGNPYASLVRVEWPDLGPYEPINVQLDVDGELTDVMLGEF